jgi:hypothetical protein
MQKAPETGALAGAAIRLARIKKHLGQENCHQGQNDGHGDYTPCRADGKFVPQSLRICQSLRIDFSIDRLVTHNVTHFPEIGTKLPFH